MLADEVDYVIGVDTHRDQHTLAVIAAPAGAVLAQTVVGANTRGYAAALGFVDEHAPGVRAWAVEGVGHYGAGLTRYLGERGETVLEVGRQMRSERRLGGKNDTLDAIRAARTGLAVETVTLPRSGERQSAPDAGSDFVWLSRQLPETIIDAFRDSLGRTLGTTS